jgi:hypothetical protein
MFSLYRVQGSLLGLYWLTGTRQSRALRIEGRTSYAGWPVGLNDLPLGLLRAMKLKTT